MKPATTRTPKDAAEGADREAASRKSMLLFAPERPDDAPRVPRDDADGALEAEFLGDLVEEGVEVVAVGEGGDAEQVIVEHGGEEKHGDALAVRDLLAGVEEYEGAGPQLGA